MFVSIFGFMAGHGLILVLRQVVAATPQEAAEDCGQGFFFSPLIPVNFQCFGFRPQLANQHMFSWHSIFLLEMWSDVVGL